MDGVVRTCNDVEQLASVRKFDCIPKLKTNFGNLWKIGSFVVICEFDLKAFLFGEIGTHLWKLQNYF